jgi:nuclear transport factor 2 (NTF2) superfamily protein
MTMAEVDGAARGRIDRVYEAFNARQIDVVLAALHPEVDWPNGWEGGYVHGRDAVRAYWTRQWAAIDPRVAPQRLWVEADGRIGVEVQQVVHDKEGALLANGLVHHVYRERDGLFDHMEIREVTQAAC